MKGVGDGIADADGWLDEVDEDARIAAAAHGWKVPRELIVVKAACSC